MTTSRCAAACVYATVLIDAGTGRVSTLCPAAPPTSRRSGCGPSGVEVVCRDGSGADGEAVRRALPGAVQVSDRWHLWHLLAGAVRKEVAAHCACWAKGSPSSTASGPRPP